MLNALPIGLAIFMHELEAYLRYGGESQDEAMEISVWRDLYVRDG